MRFKPGNKVVCIADGSGMWTQKTNLNWLQYLGLQSRKTIGPKFNEIVTVDIYRDVNGGISLKEYNTYRNGQRNLFFEIHFEPLISDNILEAELASCREPDFI